MRSLSIDDVPSEDAPFHELETFAATFNSYQQPRPERFDSVYRCARDEGVLPTTLEELRACLFLNQSALQVTENGLAEGTQQRLAREIVRAIRGLITPTTVPAPPGTPDVSRFFLGFAAKRLTRVEVGEEDSSTQHEFQGVSSLRTLLGTTERRGDAAFSARFLYLGDDTEPVTTDSTLSWYDARAKASERNGGRRRSEWHAYYPHDVTLVHEHARVGDLLVIIRKRDDSLLVLILQNQSEAAANVSWLLGLPEELGVTPIAADIVGSGGQPSFAVRRVLASLGIEAEPHFDSSILKEIERLVRRFPDSFPSTQDFADSAQKVARDVDPLSSPDGAIIGWSDTEERIFMGFERHVLERKLIDAYRDGRVDVTTVIATMKSAFQRRRSRAGTSLELHLQSVFRAHSLKFDRHAVTEPPATPDFLFPSEDIYRSSASSEFVHLTMLAVKTTAKDRWRQVLTEAERIQRKHLFTLQPGISPSQTNEMSRHNLQLVLPTELHPTFRPEQREGLLTLQNFVELVRDRQRAFEGNR